MFDIHPIVWMQSWESPALTAVMNGISLLGYTRVYVGVAVLLAFAFRVRAAVALLVLLGLSGAITDIAKAAAEAPRPDWVHGEVRALSLYASEFRDRKADTPTETEDSYGFPSGHVSATTVFMVGLALLLRWGRRGWAAAVLWIALMAVSRMYLGRHFLGDVVGGLGIGLAATGLAFAVLRLGELAREMRAHDAWPAHRIIAVALVFSGGALLVGLPDAGDAGRLLGTGLGVLVLVQHDVFEFAITRRARAILFASAAFGFGLAWGLMKLALQDADPSSVSALRLAASALPNAAVLILPALLPRHVMLRSVGG